MTEKRKQREVKVERAVLRKFRRLEEQNELLRQRVQHQDESIAALRDVIQTFQARTNLEGAIHKTELQALIKAVTNEQ
ncbi:hypothetical protein [Gimesia fumaroli]|uniref:Uncharacterized protein n=1 Tax=Gimesia fumaroli TaxID=2527976 RepID=A0A518I8V6_9PLAN|nr:hypothetical protein [Gimesia fumaroli]QDV49545.1 hypothetical protein Enr17x_15650 [Gimesia fumaroli]